MNWRKRQSEYDRIHRRMSRLFGFIFGAIQGAVPGLLISLAVKTFQVFFPGDIIAAFALGGLMPHRDPFFRPANKTSCRAGESQFVTRRVTATLNRRFSLQAFVRHRLN